MCNPLRKMFRRSILRNYKSFGISSDIRAFSDKITRKPIHEKFDHTNILLTDIVNISKTNLDLQEKICKQLNEINVTVSLLAISTTFVTVSIVLLNKL